jgi:hypothetical protein
LGQIWEFPRDFHFVSQIKKVKLATPVKFASPQLNPTFGGVAAQHSTGQASYLRYPGGILQWRAAVGAIPLDKYLTGQAPVKFAAPRLNTCRFLLRCPGEMAPKFHWIKIQLGKLVCLRENFVFLTSTGLTLTYWLKALHLVDTSF